MKRRTSALLQASSAIVPTEGAPDLNVLINHRHEDAAVITTIAVEPFVFDPRLF